jgi:hypothetical protein
MRVFALAAMAVMAVMASAAHADLITATFKGVNPSVGVTYYVSHPALNRNAGTSAGAFNWVRAGVPGDPGPDNDWGGLPNPGDDFITFCIELDQYISFDNTYTYTVGNVQDAQWQGDATLVDITPLQAEHVRELWSYGLNQGGFADRFGGTAQQRLNSKAMQVAVWEIVYEVDLDSDPLVEVYNYDVGLKGDGSGQGIRFTSGDAAVLAEAQSWLDKVANDLILPGDTVVKAMLSEAHQDQGFLLTGSPAIVIPMPASFWGGLVVLAGLGAIRVARSRRRRDLPLE